MFWRLGFHQKSPLETLLERDDATLEEVLDQEDLLQEAKAGAEKLIAFLAREDNILRLIEYTTSACDETATDKRRYKLPYIASEILVTDVPQLCDAVVGNKTALHQLFSFLENSTLPPTHALYFVRVVQTLFNKKPQELTAYLMEQDGEFAVRFLRHIDSFGMNELILTLLGAMDDEDRVPGGLLARWWIKHDFLAHLFSRLTPECGADAHINTIRMLCELVRRSHNPSISTMAENLMKPETCASFLDLMLKNLEEDCKSTVFSEGTNLLISVIDALVRKDDQYTQDTDDNGVNHTFRAILARAGQLVDILKNPGPLEQIELTCGPLQPPLGMARLKTVELLVVLLKTRRMYVEEEFIRLDVVNICLDLFFAYDMNNLLHILVEEIVTSCLLSTNTVLIAYLFDTCHVLDRLLAVTDTDAKDPPGSRPRRPGYFGHITSISNKIVQAAEGSSIVQAQTCTNQQWAAYVKATLAARNAVDTTVLGGTSPGNKSPPRSDSSPDILANFQQNVIHLPPTTTPVEPPQPPSVRYAADSSGHDIEEGENLSPIERDPEFDARDFLGTEQPAEVQEEEIWEEKQIVDLAHGNTSANPAKSATSPQNASAPLPDKEAIDEDLKEFNSLNFWSLEPRD
eukprot:TRINITY_DN1155_c0_g1_i1.p1 TRINITY_DN1155_c0_g1~~TRINITY_DN1155_c0_g1_i1.p1  ORF type:complete len:630 (+),score=95.07 TRINITY_DN1155_c0_g1_i1:897-2786(+)